MHSFQGECSVLHLQRKNRILTQIKGKHFETDYGNNQAIQARRGARSAD